jgi:hypothetical protein
MTIHRVLASMFFGLLLAVPTAAVHAGGMGIGTGGAYECYLGSGASPTGTMTLTDEFTGRMVTLGGLRLVCTPVNGSGWTGLKNLIDPPAACDPDAPVPCGDHLKCYDVRAQGGGASTADLTLSDFFFSAAPTTATKVSLVCVGAQITPTQ